MVVGKYAHNGKQEGNRLSEMVVNKKRGIAQDKYKIKSICLMRNSE